MKKYFTNWWCCLDFFIVTVSVISIYYSDMPHSKARSSGRKLSSSTSSSLSVLRVLRTMRALRPLRALSRFQGMRVVVDALMKAIPSIGKTFQIYPNFLIILNNQFNLVLIISQRLISGNVFLVCMIFWLIFSILGVNLFGGRFGRCVNIQTKRILPSRCPSPTGCDGKNQWLTYSQNRKRCMQIRDYYLKTQNRTVVDWKVPEVNFDNVWNGYLALLQVATFMGWLEIMHNAVDIRGEDLQPEYEATMWSYVYFIIFIVCGSFFCLNLFIGVIIDNFNQQKVKKKSNGFDDGVFLTDEQRQYYDAMRKMAAKTPKKPIPRPKNRFAAAVYNLVTDRRFELAVMVAILLNMVVMAIESHDANDNILFILEQLNNVFVGIFGAEVILKLIGLRQHYFTVPWNVFDLVVVVVSVVASALSDLISHFVQPTIFRIVRLFRVTRVLRLIREAKVIHTYCLCMASKTKCVY